MPSFREAMRTTQVALKRFFILLGFLFVPYSAYYAQDGRLLQNGTPSVPTGLYWHSHEVSGPLERGDLVAYQFTLPQWVQDRQWTHMNHRTRLLKRVVGLPGDRVEIRVREGLEEVFLCSPSGDCELVATRLPTDRKGEPWPKYPEGEIPADHLFLLAEHPVSFDSRYFGPVSVNGVEGVLTPMTGEPLSEDIFDRTTYGPEEIPIVVRVPPYVSEMYGWTDNLKDDQRLTAKVK